MVDLHGAKKFLGILFVEEKYIDTYPEADTADNHNDNQSDDSINDLVEKQDEHGLWMRFMPNHPHEGSFHPRFNLWYAESLIYGFEMTGDKRYLMAAKKTAEVFARVQAGDGTIYYKNYLSGRANKNSLCGSAVSFAAIVWLRLIEHGVGDEFKDNVERSLSWVLKNRFSPDHSDPNLAGGFYEIRTRHKRGKLWITIRDIATSFGLRFLTDYYNYALK